MGDLKYLWRKIITTPLPITVSLQGQLSTDSGQQGPRQTTLGLSRGQWVAPMLLIFTCRELSITSRPHFSSGGYNCSDGTTSCLALLPQLLLPSLLHGDGYRKLEKMQLEKFLCLPSVQINGCMFLWELDWNFSMPAVAFLDNSAAFTWVSSLITKR